MYDEKAPQLLRGDFAHERGVVTRGRHISIRAPREGLRSSTNRAATGETQSPPGAEGRRRGGSCVPRGATGLPAAPPRSAHPWSTPAPSPSPTASALRRALAQLPNSCAPHHPDGVYRRVELGRPLTVAAGIGGCCVAS